MNEHTMNPVEVDADTKPNPSCRTAQDAGRLRILATTQPIENKALGPGCPQPNPLTPGSLFNRHKCTN